MDSQSANRVESTELPNGRCTQFGEETLRELNKVNFPGSAVEAMTVAGEGQADQGAFAAHRGD
jgi:hypothetical protein